MRVKALVGLTFDREGLRVEPGETCDIDTALAESWIEQGLVEAAPEYTPKRYFRDEEREQLAYDTVEDELT